VILVLLAGSLLAANLTTSRRSPWLPDVLGLAASIAGMLALAGHLLGVTPFYSVADLAVSFPAALCAVALSVGFFASQPRQGLMLLLTSRGPDGVVARRLLPLPLLVPLLLGSLRLASEQMGWWPSPISVWLFALLNVACLTYLVWWTAWLLRLTDNRRKRAKHRLRLANERLEQRVAERTAELQASEEKYRMLTELMPQIVWTARGDGTIDYLNERWYEYTGLTPTASRTSGWQAVLQTEDFDRRVARWSQAVRSGERYEVEYRLRRGTDEAYRWHLERGLPMRDSAGSVVRWFGTSTDIHDQRVLEEQLRQSQKMEAVGRLAAGVAHDFNNLLTVIGGYTQLLIEEVSVSEQRARLQEVFKASQRASSLTQQLLAFSRRQVLQPQAVDLNALIANLTKMLQRLIGEDVRLVTHLASDLRPVRADPGQLEQVIVNLVVNARDAMPKGGRITVETAHVELDALDADNRLELPAGAYVMLAVSDTGHGMDAATQARIFEPFFTTKAAGKGTGLGLSTVYGIVKQSGGAIWIYSELGRGTAFKIYFPEAPHTPGVGSDAVPAETPPPHAGSETILVVEDDESVRRLASLVLRQSGYSVLTAATGIEALQICEREVGRIDLVVSDIVMPGMDAFEMRERLQEAYPNLRLLLMSGYTEHAVVRTETLETVEAFISKPFTAQELAAKVRAVLRTQPSQDARSTSGDRLGIPPVG
jgi:PAS domain S-box-containing protein